MAKAERIVWCSCAVLCLWQLCGIAIISYFLAALRGNTNFEPTDDPIFRELVSEWSEVPFVDLKVVKLGNDTYDCPTSHPDEVIQEYWLGKTIHWL